MRNFISLLDYTYEELVQVLDRADYLSTAWEENRMPKGLLNKRVGLWFYGNGFRNRLAFEIGAVEMGATVSHIPGELGIHEPLEDIGAYLQNWYSMLIIRSKSHEELIRLSESTDIPIINARTDFSHPCEIMGDLQFIRKHRGSLDELNVVFVGEKTNLCTSWFEAAVKFPLKVTQVAPEDYLADKIAVLELNNSANGRIYTSTELEPLLPKADLIYTDCWPKVNDPGIAKEICDKFLPYQITEKHLALIDKRGMFLPCPPVTRGQEVSAAAMKSDICYNYKAKNYLLHCQNAIMETLMKNS